MTTDDSTKAQEFLSQLLALPAAPARLADVPSKLRGAYHSTGFRRAYRLTALAVMLRSVAAYDLAVEEEERGGKPGLRGRAVTSRCERG